MSTPDPQRSSTAARLKLTGLHKRLGGAGVVAGIDMTVEAGESVVLLGPSGCGKTTTLRLVAGFLRPDGGEIHLEGVLASGPGVFVPTERRKLGMVFQNYALWPHKTVHDNIAFGLAHTGLGRAEIRRKVGHILEVTHLDALGGRYPGELSGGQQQRVALARAIVKEPDLLLLDEPLSNLDAGLRVDMRTELKRLHRERGMTMLYVTHDQEEALVLADRIAVMNQGRIEQFDAPETIYRRPRSSFVAAFVGVTNLIAVRILAKDPAGGRLQVESGLGAPFWAGADARFLEQCRIGDAATVAVRPEDVRLSTGSGFPCAITDVSFLGNRYEFTLDSGGMSIRAESRRGLDPTAGPPTFDFDPDAARVMP